MDIVPIFPGLSLLIIPAAPQYSRKTMRGGFRFLSDLVTFVVAIIPTHFLPSFLRFLLSSSPRFLLPSFSLLKKKKKKKKKKKTLGEEEYRMTGVEMTGVINATGNRPERVGGGVLREHWGAAGIFRKG